jgi:hypothetical protein
MKIYHHPTTPPTPEDPTQRCRHLALTFEARCLDCGAWIDQAVSTLPVYSVGDV